MCTSSVAARWIFGDMAGSRIEASWDGAYQTRVSSRPGQQGLDFFCIRRKTSPVFWTSLHWINERIFSGAFFDACDTRIFKARSIRTSFVYSSQDLPGLLDDLIFEFMSVFSPARFLTRVCAEIICILYRSRFWRLMCMSSVAGTEKILVWLVFDDCVY